MPMTSNTKRRTVRVENDALPYDAVRNAARVGSFTEIRGGAAVHSR